MRCVQSHDVFVRQRPGQSDIQPANTEDHVMLRAVQRQRASDHGTFCTRRDERRVKSVSIVVVVVVVVMCFNGLDNDRVQRVADGGWPSARETHRCSSSDIRGGWSSSYGNTVRSTNARSRERPRSAQRCCKRSWKWITGSIVSVTNNNNNNKNNNNMPSNKTFIFLPKTKNHKTKQRISFQYFIMSTYFEHLIK